MGPTSRAIIVGVAVALLTGCGGSSSPGSVPATAIATTSGSSSNGDVLWVSSACGVKIITGICQFSYPSLEYTDWLEYYYGVYGMCADRRGHVFMVGLDSASDVAIMEFSQGGSVPFKVLGIGNNEPSGGCGVEGTSEDLAVADSATGTTPGGVSVYSHARGNPIDYRVANLFNARFCGYDALGDLFVDGHDRKGAIHLDERVKGSHDFTSITLDKKLGAPGPIEWDGQHLAVGYGDGNGSMIYRVAVSGSDGKVVGITHLIDPKPLFKKIGPFWIEGNTVVATYAAPDGFMLGVWKYPQGGLPIKFTRKGGVKVYSTRYLTISSKSGA